MTRERPKAESVRQIVQVSPNSRKTPGEIAERVPPNLHHPKTAAPTDRSRLRVRDPSAFLVTTRALPGAGILEDLIEAGFLK